MMIRATASPAPAAITRVELSRWFYVGMALAALAVVASGFGPRVIHRTADMPPLTLRVVLHAALFSSWVALFIAQTLLVATGRTRTHRRLGVATLGVATAMVAWSPLLAIGLARRGLPDPDPLVFLLILLVDILLFGTFVAAATYWRRRAGIHKRLMLLATTQLLPAAIVRWPFAEKNPAPAVSVVLGAFVIAMLANDVAERRRPHPVTVWGGLLIFVSLPVRFAIAQTPAWHHFAQWLIR